MQDKQNASIGVFDSGLGGLTALKEISKILPNENIIYLGDTARVPYGTRSKKTIIKFSIEDANFLASKKVKCIVIACNTSSALAGKELKNKFNIPVFEVITPTLKYAKSVSKNGKIGVIGTNATIESGVYNDVFKAVACPLFVPFIEEGRINDESLGLIAKDYLSVFKGSNIDTLIMGCTHYPIIKNIIENEIGTNVKLIDSGKIIAEELKKYLIENNLQNNQNEKGKKEYYVTDLTTSFTKVAEMFLGERIKGRINIVSLNS